MLSAAERMGTRVLLCSIVSTCNTLVDIYAVLCCAVDWFKMLRLHGELHELFAHELFAVKLVKYIKYARLLALIAPLASISESGDGALG